MHPAGSSFFSPDVDHVRVLTGYYSFPPLPSRQGGTLFHSTPCLHPFRDIIPEMKAAWLDASVVQFLTTFYRSLSSGDMSLAPLASCHVRRVSAVMEERCEGFLMVTNVCGRRLVAGLPASARRWRGGALARVGCWLCVRTTLALSLFCPGRETNGDWNGVGYREGGSAGGGLATSGRRCPFAGRRADGRAKGGDGWKRRRRRRTMGGWVSLPLGLGLFRYPIPPLPLCEREEGVVSGSFFCEFFASLQVGACFFGFLIR
ncbi:uncharacterized protein LY79DRAFT_83414 [Colletotrichum navitas]|uniref:Uncharacterized protein n=1 Tax=Colletotrichum navitas TaxID=681940 RepID=A0AAD8Q5D6_9PEZI|nr:uncharacterized protein LY79DRAFT_83414 [Colletotrichum navitas]KAK1596190.1 hypothetical protein LY79DRAFT_83414 [Colletotrichum navitas]